MTITANKAFEVGKAYNMLAEKWGDTPMAFCA